MPPRDDHSPDPIKVGRRIEALRGELVRVSQSALAKRAGIDRAHLNRIERGKQLPTVATTGAIVRAIRDLAREQAVILNPRPTVRYVRHGDDEGNP